MSPLELRKIVVIGIAFVAPDGAPLLDGDGLPADPLKHPVKIRVAFWVPQKQPFQRCSGATSVAVGALPFEVQALKDGAIVEQVQDFAFPRQPSIEEMRRALMPHWERLTLASLGVVPNAPKVDKAPKLGVLFNISNRQTEKVFT